MKLSAVLSLFLIFSFSNNVGFVRCTLTNHNLWKIIHQLFPPTIPTTIRPPLVHSTFWVEPSTGPFTPTVQPSNVPDVLTGSTPTPLQPTTITHAPSSQDKINKELRQEVLDTITQITDIMLLLPAKVLTIVSAILPILGDIIDIISVNTKVV